MFAIFGFVAFVIAAFLHFTAGHASAVVWAIIIGGLLVAAEVAWGWNRGGRYGRRTTP
jgi:hypothetical protein